MCRNDCINHMSTKSIVKYLQVAYRLIRFTHAFRNIYIFMWQARQETVSLKERKERFVGGFGGRKGKGGNYPIIF